MITGENMPDPTKEQMTKFLIGLEKLSRETGVVIYSADRVYTIEEAGDEPEAGYSAESRDYEVLWVSPSDSYDWEMYSHLITKGKDNEEKHSHCTGCGEIIYDLYGEPKKAGTATVCLDCKHIEKE